ncbi:MAG: hypothetical protein V3W11_04660 [bacterium]
MAAPQCIFCSWKMENFGNQNIDDSCPEECSVKQLKSQATRLNQMTLVQGRKFKKLVEVLEVPPEKFDAAEK